MGDNARRAYAEWQLADRAAREAEKRLSGAWIAHEMGGEAPSAQLIGEVTKLRAIANEKLSLAVAALGATRATPTPGGKGKA